MDRYKWYELSFSAPFISLANAMGEHRYDDSIGYGISLSKSRKDSVDGFFIEKKTLKTDRENPFGEVEVIESVEYVRIWFRIRKVLNGGVMEVKNSSRSLRTFIRVISSLCGDDFAMSKMLFNISELYSSISVDSRIERFVVEKVVANSIAFSKNSTARLQLYSPTNALEELQRKYNVGKYELESLQLHARVGGESESCLLKKGGTLACSAGLYNVVVSNLFDLS